MGKAILVWMVKAKNVDCSEAAAIVSAKMLNRRKAKASSGRHLEEPEGLAKCIAIGLLHGEPREQLRVCATERRSELPLH